MEGSVKQLKYPTMNAIAQKAHKSNKTLIIPGEFAVGKLPQVCDKRNKELLACKRNFC